MLSSPLFTSGEVQRLVGISQQHLTYWDQSALVHPTGRAAHGRGSRRLYTLMDVLQLKLIRRLREAGLSLQKVRRALTVLSQVADEPALLGELEVLTDGRRIIVHRSDERLLEPVARQYFLRLPLSALLAEVESSATSVAPDQAMSPASPTPAEVDLR